jgi:hypothetical protein
MNVTWMSVTRHASTNYSASFWKVPGHYLLSLYEKNYTIKVYELLTPGLQKEYMYMSKRKYLRNKMDLLEEFSHPRPFPATMFSNSRLPKGSSNQQPYVILGQKGTGR